MGMPINLNVYEALTDAGVSPDKARAVERQLESAIQAGHSEIRAEWREQLMTKADAASMKAELKADLSAIETRLNQRFNDQLRWIITTQIAVIGLAVAAIKLL